MTITKKWVTKRNTKMNERIDELAFQSGITQHSYSNPKHPDLDGFLVSNEKLEKFAELIVNECIDRLTQDDFGSVKGVMRIAGAKLKEHFGVE
jgi:hypothetical protein